MASHELTEGQEVSIPGEVADLWEHRNNDDPWAMFWLTTAGGAVRCTCVAKVWRDVSRRPLPGTAVTVHGRWMIDGASVDQGPQVLVSTLDIHIPERIATWSLPAVLDANKEKAAVQMLTSYFLSRSRSDPRRPLYTGSMFERLGGGGDRPAVADMFTAEDIVAVSTLSVNIPAQASIRILGADGPRLSMLLRAIPADADLVDAGAQLIDDDSPAHQLYRHLRSYSGMGEVMTSKLLARKRPRLIPVIDKEPSSSSDTTARPDLATGTPCGSTCAAMTGRCIQPWLTYERARTSATTSACCGSSTCLSG